MEYVVLSASLLAALTASVALAAVTLRCLLAITPRVAERPVRGRR